MKISLYGSLKVSKLDLPLEDDELVGIWNSPRPAVLASADSRIELSGPVTDRFPVAERPP